MAVLAGSLSACDAAALLGENGRLPTFGTPEPGTLATCGNLQVNGVLQVSAVDPRVAWLATPAGARTELVWPPGFTARFDRPPVIVDAEGRVAATSGRSISLGGSFEPGSRTFKACQIGGRVWG